MEQYLREIIKEIDSELDSIKEELLFGIVESFSDFKTLSGKARGLLQAKNIAKDRLAKYIEEE